MEHEPELTTVADDEAVVHHGSEVRRFDDLAPDTLHEIDGLSFRTLPRLGERLCTVATVNDLHFGEIECGVLDGRADWPTHRSDPDEDPHPEVMNRAAVAEIAAIAPEAVLAKGDITTHGSAEEYRTFLDLYGSAFGDRLHHVRGNHDAYSGETHGDHAPYAIDLPGVTLAVLDTVIPGRTTGTIGDDQIEWLDDVAAVADRPVLVMGHHQSWVPGGRRSPDYFGVDPDSSEALVAVIARRRRILGYFAGHTHRNRVRRVEASGAVPYVEVACVKDYPGSWAEYRVFEGGILHVHRRISAPEALAWSNRCRDIYPIDYETYALGRLEDRCLALTPRA